MEVLSFCSRKPKGYYFEAVEVAVVFIFKNNRFSHTVGWFVWCSGKLKTTSSS
uniref:Uncharacterized protein n=1 Tax=Anguilla anguilla TaxID=7936 RepID=A0A0E9SZH1_ANGAN